MECNLRTEGQFTVVTLSGDVDLHYSPEARKQILEQLKANKNVLVDLSGVSYIDSSGIASLVEGFQLARNRKLQFGLVGVSEAAQQVLQLARLDKIFQIKDSIGDFINQ
ncbi:MAG: STAS domain-containing protein [Gammaproteobacteria bacterium]|jgi:anti-sigma B factor antagonist